MAQFLNYSHETWEAKVWLLSSQRLSLCPGTQENHSASQRDGGNLLKTSKFRSQIPMTVNGDQQ